MFRDAACDPYVADPGGPAVPGMLMRWTLPVDGALRGRVRTVVAEVYEEWGAAPHQADPLGDLAVDLVDELLRKAWDRPVRLSVTALLEGARATVSAVRGAGPVSRESAVLSLRGLENQADDESAHGTLEHAAGTLHWASVPLGARRSLRRSVSHRYHPDRPGAAEHAAFGTARALGIWGVRMLLAAALGEEASALVVAAAAAGTPEIIVVTVYDGACTASVHAVSPECTHGHPEGLLDPATDAAARAATGIAPGGCACLALALPGPAWARRAFVAVARPGGPPP
ncbi:hypothetical protein [Streptomyces sp. NPDC087294]|uniref:hypothetical protein n=1 Tax=Streptomyces sp. NPDC087294 TaxID=3365777 RepID=UPI00382B25BA